ncbi:MAG: serine/threonine protein kinase [Gammaproteobacteria bacterium]|nr:serine/threonine protein kinase [Gammaproteobacteria bacterium]
MSELTGEVIGPYQITDRLGRGGMADVYKAFHTELKIYRAIKFIRPEFVTSEDFRARFQKEAQSVARLRHANIVNIHDFGSDDDRFYMVMEFVEGQDLKSLLRTQGAFDIPRSVAIIVAVADALQYAHQRDLIHRDIKPENIMLDAEGTPVLMDFGIAKLLTAETQLTQTGMGIGTPAYMAPEQAKGLEVGPAADIYSLAIVLFEMVTGQVPFSADTPMAVMLKAIGEPLPIPRTLNDDISEALQGVILKGTAKEPDDRYQSAAAFAADLKRAMSNDGATVVRAVPETVVRDAAGAEAETVVRGSAAATEVLPRKSKSRMPLIAVAVMVLLLAVGGVFLFLPLGGGTGPDPDNDSKPPPGSPEGEVEPVRNTPATGENPVLYAYREDIGADETVKETIELEAGDTIFLNVHDTAATTDFVLMKPGGREQVFSTYSDAGPHTVASDGDFELSMAMRGSKSGMVDVELLKLEPAVIDGGALTPGSFFAATTQLPGQFVSYTVDLSAGDGVFFDVTRSESTTDFTLVGPDGRGDVFSGYSDAGPHEIKKSGTHTLAADVRGDKLGDFEANLYRLEPAVIDGGALTLNDYVSAETRQPGQSISYNVELEAGTVLFFKVESTSATTDFTLANGRRQLFTGYSNQGPIEVERSGVHTFTMDPRGDKLSVIEVILHTVDPPEIDGGAITFNEYFTGETSKPGQQVAYPVSLSAGDVVYLDVVKTSNTTDFVLASPDGRNEVFSRYADTGPWVVERAGDYRLTANPRGDKLSEFEATLYRLDPPQIDGGRVMLGQTISGSTEMPGQLAAYTVELEGGTSIKLDVIKTSAGATDFKLIAPDGNEIFSSYNDTKDHPIAAAGVYTLSVDPRADDVPQFEVVLLAGDS